MAINRGFFFNETRERLFQGVLKQQQVTGLTAVLDKWENETAKADDRWLAYMLATVYHETARTMQPVRETLASSDDKAISILNNAFAKGQLPWVSNPYWRKDSDGKSWLGRGLVQLTHKTNYAKMSKLTGVDLLAKPERAMEMDVALKILFEGMRLGSFTSHKLADYFNDSKEDWVNARKIINWLDKAQAIGDYGRKFYGCISYTTA